MTTPNVPLRMELTFEMPGTPEQVWDAIATGNGQSSWFAPTEIEEREGGTYLLRMGDSESRGTVRAWERPRRFVIDEPDWATLAGQEAGTVTPMVTEFLVEAQSGGTCVVRVVSSAFGTGADWEKEFFEEMERHWLPFFDNLRLYLTHFPGQRVTPFETGFIEIPVAASRVLDAIGSELGAGAAGEPVDGHGLTGVVEAASGLGLLVRLTAPVPGYLMFGAFDAGESTNASVQGYLFSDDAASFAEREGPAWRRWLQSLATPALDQA